MKQIDLVVAVRDEEEAIPWFVDEVRGLRLPDGVQLKLLFVEDSSKDGTRDVLRHLAGQSSDVAYYAVQNDFGQGPAIVFGIARSMGDAVITMDVDGTHPISAIPVLVTRFLQGDDIVQCVRKAPPDRQAYRNIGAAAFHVLAHLLTGVDTRTQNVYYRLMSAGVASEFLRHPRYWRFLRLPLSRTRGRLSFVEVDGVDRSVGQSKYNPIRLLNVAIDGVLSLMSGTRLMASTTVAFVIAWLLWQPGAQWLTVCILLVQAGIVARYFALAKPDLLTRMTVLEYAGRATVASERRAG